MEPIFAIVVGFSAAFVYWFFAQFLIRLQIDDVVGAVAVHGAAGAWGTLCAGMFVKGNLFDVKIMATQLVGVITCFIWAFGITFIVAWLIHKTLGLRVSVQHEQRGLDFTEHAEVAYPEFLHQTYYNKENLKNIER
jgi:Amt family ammonium transporter